ncbi:MAG: hypothetical protein DRJ03_30730 [Chloroflexi bacterium]|nr:MAG: hypothetical protein DRJ03_30730 [Chloroflexota bacterium]
MKARLMTVSVIAGLVMVLGLLVSITSAANVRPAREMNLTLGGEVYEVTPDTQGNLWLSEYSADRVWQVNWATGAYTIYQGLPSASDARRDTAGDVWWADYDGGRLGRISLNTGTVTTWTLPGADSPWGIAFDDAGQVWIADDDLPNVYSFNPTSTQVCTYTYDGSYSSYVLFHKGYLWLGDYGDAQVVRLDPVTNQFARWSLTSGASPYGLAMSSNDHLWWADKSGFLGCLEPTNNKVTTYTLPGGGEPAMVVPSGESVWYTEITGTFGVLNPSVVNEISVTVVPSTKTVTPSCSVLGAGISSSVSISTGMAVWSPAVITATVNSGGWQVYQLPSGANPWGIAAVGGSVWVADAGRDKLVWFSHRVYLPIVLRGQ